MRVALRRQWHACRITALAVALASAVEFGCAGAHYMQVRPEKLYERWPGDQISYRVVGELDVSMRAILLLGLPVSMPNLVASIDTAIQEANADAVTNLQIAQSQTTLGALGWSSYHATGDLVVFE